MFRHPSLASAFSNVELLENRAMLSASVHSAGEAIHHHRHGAVHVELHHANLAASASSKFRVSDDPAGHDARDDKGVDPAGHDANDDKGVDAVEVHHDKGRGK